MRRIVLEEPLARSAAWSRSVAFFALAVAIIGIVMARLGLDPTAAVAVEGGAMAFAILAILFALVAMAVIWRTGYRGTGRLLAALVIAALVLAYPAYLVAEAHGMPALDDAATDLVDPPGFSTSAQALDARGGRVPGQPSSDQQALQRRLYPDLQSIVLDMEPLEAHRLILKLVAARRWRIVDDALPLGRFGIGRVDAIARTTIMGFPADVTIRIKAAGQQSRIDIRSVSRTPWHEPASNAERIQALASDLDDQSDDQ